MKGELLFDLGRKLKADTSTTQALIAILSDHGGLAPVQAAAEYRFIAPTKALVLAIMQLRSWSPFPGIAAEESNLFKLALVRSLKTSSRHQYSPFTDWHYQKHSELAGLRAMSKTEPVLVLERLLKYRISKNDNRMLRFSELDGLCSLSRESKHCYKYFFDSLPQTPMAIL